VRDVAAIQSLTEPANPLFWFWSASTILGIYGDKNKSRKTISTGEKYLGRGGGSGRRLT